MSELTAVPESVGAMVAYTNAKRGRKLLRDGNYTVQSVRAINKSPDPFVNTDVAVIVDLYPNATNPIPTAERYSRKVVKIYRPTLAEAVKRLEIELTEKGLLKVDALATPEDVVASFKTLGMGIEADEFTLTKVDDKVTGLRMNQNALSFTGGITLTTEGGDEEEDEDLGKTQG